MRVWSRESVVNESVVIQLTDPALKGVHFHKRQKYLMPRDETKNTATQCIAIPDKTRRYNRQLNHVFYLCLMHVFASHLFPDVYVYKAAQVNER